MVLEKIGIPRLPITLYVNLFQEIGQPLSLQIRARLSEPQLMKRILSAAHENKECIFVLSFKTKLHGINSMLEKGVIMEDGVDPKTKLMRYKYLI